MKTLYNIIGILLIIFSVAGCSDDTENLAEGRIIEEYEYGRILKANTNDVNLNITTPDAEAISLKWQSYDYTKSMAIEMCATDSFADILSTTAPSTQKTFTHSMLNQAVMSLGLQPDTRSPLYMRIRYQRTNNLGYRFSDTLCINVTPYNPPQEMEVLNADMALKATIHSPYGNGIFSGYVPAKAGMKVWLRDSNEEIYGKGEKDFQITSKDPTEPLVLPNADGCYRLRADIKSGTVSMSRILGMKLVGSDGKEYDMTYDSGNNAWTSKLDINFQNGAESQKQYIVFAKARMTLQTFDANSGYDETLARRSEETVTLSPQTISESGTYNLSVSMTGETPEFITGGSATVSGESLLMVDKDNTSIIKCKLFSPKADGNYNGLYYATGWENFLFAANDMSATYGCGPSSDKLYQLVPTTQDYWAPWIEDGSDGFRLFNVNMTKMTWSCTSISSIVVVGEGLTWDLSTGAAMKYDEATKTCRATITLKGDEQLQVVLNNNWDMKLKKKASSEALVLVDDDSEGVNIPVPKEAGSYEFIINTFDMGNITYSFEKK